MRHCPNTGVSERKIDHVKTKIFYNSITKCRASNNWRRDYVTNVKTYSDIVKGESSGVYSKTMLHKVTNVEKQYKSPINTKRAKHKGCIKKVYQGVNVALDHEAKTNHIGNFPHILPNQNNVGSVKIGSQRASPLNTGEKTGNTWSRPTEFHSTSSPTQAESEGKICHNDLNDFVSKNKFAVLAELDTDANTIQNHVCDTTAGENVGNTKVSSGNKKEVPHVSEGVVSRVVSEFPLTEDKYDLQAMF